MRVHDVSVSVGSADVQSSSASQKVSSMVMAAPTAAVGMLRAAPTAAADMLHAAETAAADKMGVRKAHGKDLKRVNKRRTAMHAGLASVGYRSDVAAALEVGQQCQASRTIQRLWRVRQIVLTRFGHEMFCMSNLEKAAHGKISFSPSGDTRPFIIVDKSTSAALLSAFMCSSWRLPRPEVLISITGGAQDFHLSSVQRAALWSGLRSAAQSANAWLFTGGTNCGIMKLVGQAGLQNPLIGIFGAGVTNNREALLSAQGKVVAYKPSKPSAQGAPLNPGTTHFVLVDDGSVHKYGVEFELRCQLEKQIADTKKAHLVQLVVQGGEGTLTVVRKMAEILQPIVLVVDSGGAAKVISEFVNSNDDAVSDASWADRIRKNRTVEAVMDDLSKIKEMNKQADGKLCARCPLPPAPWAASSSLRTPFEIRL